MPSITELEEKSLLLTIEMNAYYKMLEYYEEVILPSNRSHHSRSFTMRLLSQINEVRSTIEYLNAEINEIYMEMTAMSSD